MHDLCDTQIHQRIEHILARTPNASSKYIRQRLVVCDRTVPLYAYFAPFYDQGRIDDRADIRQELASLMSMNLGMNLIARELSNGRYNYRQVEAELLSVLAKYDRIEQARRCKEQHFGSHPPVDEHHQSHIVMSLQKKGYRLPDIWKILD